MLERVAHYEVTETLGQGAFGRVYLARDTKLNRDVALKVLDKEIEDDPLRERFHLEARAIAALKHRNIVEVLDFADPEADVQYIALEALGGKSIFEVLKEYGPAPEQTALCIGRELASALEHAHGQAIVHRDIKPENVILEAGRVVLIDFGAMKVVSSHDTVPGGSFQLQTAGTPGFMAPEQFAQGKGDHRSDIFSTGALLYNVVTGRLPYEVDVKDLKSLKKNAKGGRYIDPRYHQPLLTPGFCDILADCLATRPGDRLDSAQNLRLRIEALLEAHGIEDLQPVLRLYCQYPALDQQHDLRTVDVLMREFKLALLRDFQQSVQSQEDDRIKDATNRLRFVYNLFDDAERYFLLDGKVKPKLLRGRIMRRGRWFLMGLGAGLAATLVWAVFSLDALSTVRDFVEQHFGL